MIVQLLTEIRSNPGTIALASFLVALERDAFCLPQACGPINHWASGTADGLCLLPGTVTGKYPQLFLHFCMNLATCSTYKAFQDISIGPQICAWL